MKYLLWGFAILLAAVVLFFGLSVLVGVTNAVRTMRRYGDVGGLALSGGRLRAFLRAVEDHFRRRGRAVRIRDGVVYLSDDEASRGGGRGGGDDNDQDAGPSQLGLQNLAQLCAQVEPAQWPQTIARHFDALESSRAEAAVALADVEDYEKVKSLLAVRLMPKEGVPLDTMVYREDLDGTISNLVFDLPSSIRTVHVDEERRWPVGQSEIFRTALANTRRLSAPETAEVDLGDGVKLTAVTGSDNYVTTHALMLDEHPEWLGPHGALFAVPHRHALLVFPIRDAGVLQAVQKLALIARGMEKEGPGSITSNLFWYRRADGKSVHLPYEIKDKEFIFRPPPEFVAMLEEAVKA
jgi:hypothetical protein